MLSKLSTQENRRLFLNSFLYHVGLSIMLTATAYFAYIFLMINMGLAVTLLEPNKTIAFIELITMCYGILFGLGLFMHSFRDMKK